MYPPYLLNIQYEFITVYSKFETPMKGSFEKCHFSLLMTCVEVGFSVASPTRVVTRIFSFRNSRDFHEKLVSFYSKKSSLFREFRISRNIPFSMRNEFRISRNRPFHIQNEM